MKKIILIVLFLSVANTYSDGYTFNVNNFSGLSEVKRIAIDSQVIRVQLNGINASGRETESINGASTDDKYFCIPKSNEDWKSLYSTLLFAKATGSKVGFYYSGTAKYHGQVLVEVRIIYME